MRLMRMAGAWGRPQDFRVRIRTMHMCIFLVGCKSDAQLVACAVWKQSVEKLMHALANIPVHVPEKNLSESHGGDCTNACAVGVSLH